MSGVSLRAVAAEKGSAKELAVAGERFSRLAERLRGNAGRLADPVLEKILECLPGPEESPVAALVSFSENVERLRKEQEGVAEGSGAIAEYKAFIALALQRFPQGDIENRRSIQGGERLMGIFLKAAGGDGAAHSRPEERKFPPVPEKTETGKRVGEPTPEGCGRRSFVGVSRLLGRMRELALPGGGRDAERLETTLLQFARDMETWGEGLIDIAEKFHGGASTGEAWADGLLERLRVPPAGEPGRGTAFLERFAAEAGPFRRGGMVDVSAMGVKALERLVAEEDEILREWDVIIKGLDAGVKANAKPNAEPEAEPEDRPVPEPECEPPPSPEPEAVSEPVRGTEERTADVPEGRRTPAGGKPTETRKPPRWTGSFAPRAGRRDEGADSWKIEYMVRKRLWGGVTLEISGSGKGMTGLPALVLRKKASSVPLHDEDGMLVQRIPAHSGLRLEIPLAVGPGDAGCHFRLFLDRPSPRLEERTDLYCKGNRNKI